MTPLGMVGVQVRTGKTRERRFFSTVSMMNLGYMRSLDLTVDQGVVTNLGSMESNGLIFNKLYI